MDKKNRPSLQDIIKRRQQSNFVGRQEHIASFQANLARSWDDEQRLFIFYVWGQGGVGKTTLIRHLRQVAEQAGAVATFTDEAETDVPVAMARFAAQLKAQGYECKKYDERYKVYRQKREELEIDPDAPQGFTTFAARTLTKATTYVTRQFVPGSGLVLDLIDEDALTAQVSDWADYVRRRLTNKDEVRLVLEPVEILTPLFLEEIEAVTAETTVVLFFDTYELTSTFLDNWIRAVLGGRYGDIPADIILVIAGRDELEHNLWLPYEGVMARLSLEPFTETEVHDYLTRQGITSGRVIETILQLSGRLPLLVATLAAESPNDPAEVDDPSTTAIARFLKWVSDPKRREIALNAALPRELNRDVLALLTDGQDEIGSLFDWLKGMPFVQERADSWVYHEVVRTQMLRHKRRESPKSWAALHEKLASHYEHLRDSPALDEKQRWHNVTWQRLTLNVVYHRRCQSLQGSLSATLNGFLQALQADYTYALHWADVIQQAENETEPIESGEFWGQKLVAAMRAFDAGEYKKVISTFKLLLRRSDLAEAERAIAMTWLGRTYRRLQQFDMSLDMLNQAVEQDPKNYWTYYQRGWTFERMRRYEEAIADFNRVIELVPNHAPAIEIRGWTFQQMKRYEEALADLNHAVELRPDDISAISYLAWTYFRMGRHDEALANFDEVIERDPENVIAIVDRGQVHRNMGKYEVALASFNAAIDLDPESQHAFHNRGVNFLYMGRIEDALADFNQAIKLSDREAIYFGHRGETYRRLKQYEKALQDLNYAIRLDSENIWVLAFRGHTYQELKEYDKALADFDRLVALEPSRDWYLYKRAMMFRILGRTEESQQDFNIALQIAQQKYEASPEAWGNTFNLALYRLAVSERERATQIYQEGLANGASIRNIRYALEDLCDYLALFPDHSQAQGLRDTLQRYLKERSDE
jgi:tetratricopeptide (TPR) repeat protein